MRTATITETKNKLSALLDLVRHGETVLITDRGTPIARIVPVAGSGGTDADEARIARLERAGLLSRALEPPGPLPPPIPLPPGVSVLDALLEEREEDYR